MSWTEERILGLSSVETSVLSSLSDERGHRMINEPRKMNFVEG